MSKIKILQVIRPAAGGMKEHFLSLIKALDDKVYDILVACPGDSPIFQEVKGLGIKAFPVDIKGELSLLNDWFCIKELTRIIKDEKVHIVHSHGSKAGLVARIAGKRAGVKNVITVHGTIFHEHFSKIKKNIFASAERLLANYTEQIISVSNYLKEELIHCERIREDKITVIYNGISSEKFNILFNKNNIRKALGISSKGKVIITVARLAPQKGLSYLLDAVYLLSKDNHDFQLIIIGDGPLHGDLIEQAKNLGITEEVKFLGHRNDIPELLAAADIFCLPTLSEGLGISIIEAMAVGLPIVSTNVGGVPEIINNNENGLLVEPKDSQGLAKALESLFIDEELAHRFITKGKEKVKQEFDLNVMVPKVADVYDKIYNYSN